MRKIRDIISCVEIGLFCKGIIILVPSASILFEPRPPIISCHPWSSTCVNIKADFIGNLMKGWVDKVVRNHIDVLNDTING